MIALKRRPPAFAVRVPYCFRLDFIIAPVVRRLERSDRILNLLGAPTRRRAHKSVARNPFRGYTPGEQDVFVMAYPKSGQNWMLQIVYQLIHHGKREFDRANSTHSLGCALAGRSAAHAHVAKLRDSPAAGDSMANRSGTEAPHQDASQLGTASLLEGGPLHCRYSHPKDVFVSFYFFARNNLLGRAMPSVSAVYRSFLKGESLMGSWAVNAAGYWSQRHRANVMVASFASMKRDLDAIVRRVADVLEIRVSDEVIREVCRKSSFEHMKSIDERFAPYQGAPWRGKTFMMRTGEQGTSSALLTPQQQREMDAVLSPLGVMTQSATVRNTDSV
jgi:hypothetical protein